MDWIDQAARKKDAAADAKAMTRRLEREADERTRREALAIHRKVDTVVRPMLVEMGDRQWGRRFGIFRNYALRAEPLRWVVCERRPERNGWQQHWDVHVVRHGGIYEIVVGCSPLGSGAIARIGSDHVEFATAHRVLEKELAAQFVSGPRNGNAPLAWYDEAPCDPGLFGTIACYFRKREPDSSRGCLGVIIVGAVVGGSITAWLSFTLLL